MSIQRARTAQEYADWVQGARFEAQELRESIEYDMEGQVNYPPFLEALEEGIERLYREMAEGRYAFGREDLPLMDVAERYAAQIPFLILLKQINETHRYGLDVPEDE
jgi:hypothetical protein